VDALIDAQNAAFVAQIAARADAAYITIVDVNAEFKANANWTTEYMTDDTHPSNYGYRVMAVTLANALTAAGY
jgi:lysophospholipase L1-like esterase